jgi:hypothetical protein
MNLPRGGAKLFFPIVRNLTDATLDALHAGIEDVVHRTHTLEIRRQPCRGDPRLPVIAILRKAA